MKTTILIISSVLFLISQGSRDLHRIKNPDSFIELTSNGQTKLLVLTFLSFVMLNISINELLSFKWYWVLIIAFVLNLVMSRIFAQLYSPIFGYKTKPQFSLRAGGDVRHNLHIYDCVITLILGTIIYFVAYKIG
jgi:hypothetical protein